jgi:predicted nucleic acid-binding protein
LDTSVFVAFSNKKDKDHAKAKALLDRLRKGEFGTPYTSDYIFDEAVTVALVRTGRLDLAIKIGKLILGAPEEGIPKLLMLIRVDDHVFSEAWTAFKGHENKLLSFTDQTSLQIMKTYKIDSIMSFDSGFDGHVPRIS